MPAYTLHVQAGAVPGDAAALDKAEVVKDGFAGWAFVFQTLWFLWHRLWLGALIAFVAPLALALACHSLGAGPATTVFAELALGVFLALEANAIRAWTLGRRGRPAVDVVIAEDRDRAETRAIARWLARSPAASALRPAPALAPLAPMPVLGLFPEPERGA